MIGNVIGNVCVEMLSYELKFKYFYFTIDHTNCLDSNLFMTKKFTSLLFFVAISFFSKTIAQTIHPTIYTSLANGSCAILATEVKLVINKTALLVQNKSSNEVADLNRRNYTIWVVYCNSCTTSSFLN